MTQIAEWGNLSPELLHDLETHYHNIETLYNEGMNITDIQENLQLSDGQMFAMEDVIFAEESVYRCTDIFGDTKFYMGNNRTGRSQEIEYGN